MQTPLELVFKGLEPDPSIKALVQEQVDRLEKFYAGATSCHVYIKAPHRSQNTGNLYEVTIELRVPGKELVVRRHQNDVGEFEHLRVVVRDAFKAMERDLKRWKQEVSGDVKTHDGPLQGVIDSIDHDKGFGQIAATDHRLIYFHKNSVVDGAFEDLKPADRVELVVQTGESEIGPQASTVRPIGAMKYDPAP